MPRISPNLTNDGPKGPKVAASESEVQLGMTLNQVQEKLRKKARAWEMVYACLSQDRTEWVLFDGWSITRAVPGSISPGSYHPVLDCPIVRGPVTQLMKIQDFKSSEEYRSWLGTCRINEGMYFVYVWRVKQYCLTFKPKPENQSRFSPGHNYFPESDELIAIN